MYIEPIPYIGFYTFNIKNCAKCDSISKNRFIDIAGTKLYLSRCHPLCNKFYESSLREFNKHISDYFYYKLFSNKIQNVIQTSLIKLNTTILHKHRFNISTILKKNNLIKHPYMSEDHKYIVATKKKNINT